MSAPQAPAAHRPTVRPDPYGVRPESYQAPSAEHQAQAERDAREVGLIALEAHGRRPPLRAVADLGLAVEVARQVEPPEDAERRRGARLPRDRRLEVGVLALHL